MTQLPADLPSIIYSASPFVSKYGYLGIAGLLFLESTGIPVPGETTIVVAALFAGIGHLNILIVVLVAVLASIIGDNLAFAIGDFGGRRLIENYGKYFFITAARLKRLELFFNKYGNKIVVVARFIEGLRQLNGFIAGISNMKWPKFLLYNFLGALLWVSVWAGVGYYGGTHIRIVLKYGTYFSIGVFIIIVGLILWHVLKMRENRRTKSTISKV